MTITQDIDLSQYETDLKEAERELTQQKELLGFGDVALEEFAHQDLTRTELDEVMLSKALELQEQTKAFLKDKENLKDGYEEHGQYFIDKTGVYLKPNSEEGNPKFICSPLWPIAHLRSEDNTEHGSLVRVFDGEIYHELTISNEQIASPKDLIPVLASLNQKFPVEPNMVKHLQKFLMNVEPAEKRRCVQKAGWHGNVYVFPDGEVIGQSDGEETIHLVSGLRPLGVGSSGTLEEWQEHVLKKSKGNSRPIFSIGTALASLILRLINQEGGGVHWKGPSSIGKTRGTRTGISVLGHPKDYERSWNNTKNALEALCAMHNDSLLPMDELGRSEASQAGEMAYTITSGLNKGRLNSNSNFKPPKTWSTLVQSTGEIGLEAHVAEGNKKVRAGQAVRVVDIPAQAHPKYGCFEEIHEYKSSKDFVDALEESYFKYYGTAGREFLKRLIAGGLDNAREFLKKAREDFIATHAQGAGSQVLRVAARFGTIQATLKYAIHLDIFGGVLDETDVTQAVLKMFTDWRKDRGTDSDQESKQILEQVFGILDQYRESRFAPLENTNEDRKLTEIWGYRAGDTYYILSKAWTEQFCKGFEPSGVAKVLIAEGLLTPGGDRTSRSKRIPALGGVNRRVYEIRRVQDADDE